MNLENISITKLADQFHDFITNQKNLNLESASEYLLMATWLAYLKSKLLLPGTPEEEFKVQEVAEKLKLQLKKLELIRLLSEQMLKRKRLGREIRTRGVRAGIRPIYNSEIKVNLFELLKTYSTIIMTKDFQRMNIPKLPVFTTEDGIKTIKDLKKKVGVSLNPESKIELITEFLDQIDLVLIMSVNPGFGGQKFMPEVLDKIKQLKKIQQEKNLKFDIEIDGGINFENCKIAIDAGANILVSGTTVFESNNGDIKKNINLLKLK